jgi:ABC-type transport system involved in multi-copper enzyme maturation permease subunit
MDLVLGWIGIILVLVATAGFLPSMLEHGSIQVLLSKPMPRWMLLLSKYVGSLVFIFTQAAIFVVLTFLVAGVRWNVWLPGYLLAIPLITILFSYLYCVSALVAVLTKSTIAAIMVSLGAWVFFFAIQSAHDTFRIFPAMQEYTRVETVVSGLRWVTPKTQDITYIARKWARAASPMDLMPPPESEEDQQWVERAGNVETARMRVPAYQTIGSSLLFEIVILAIAAWKFSRQDY